MGISNKFDALVPTSMPELIEFADRISKSSLIPKEFVGKPADILVAISMGLEIGLKPVQALQSIAVINGRPSIWGSATRALVMASGQLQSLFETDPADVKRDKKARCEIVRKGFAEPFVGEFSLDDAKAAGLAGSNTYTKYLDQMLTWRAWHGAARKAFPDVYKGLAAAEELQDTEPFKRGGTDDAPPITLSLDAPTETEGPNRQVKAGKVEADSHTAAPTRRGRPPKSAFMPTSTPGESPYLPPRNQGPQAPSNASAEVSPPSPGTVAASTPEAQPEPSGTCQFCHAGIHSFNDCPENRAPEGGDAHVAASSADNATAAPATAGAAANGRTLNDEEQAEIMRMARLLRPKSAMGWLVGMLAPFGVEDVSELPVDNMQALIQRMQANA